MESVSGYRLSTRVVQEGERRCKKSTLNDLAYLTPLRIPLMNPVHVADAAGVEARSPGIPDRGDAFQMPCPAPGGDYITGLIKTLFVDEIWGRRMSSSVTPTSELHGEVDSIQASERYCPARWIRPKVGSFDRP